MPEGCVNIFVYSEIFVRFEVLTAASMKMVVFWFVAPCSLVEVYRRIRGAYSSP
jgi:tryptophan-rich sensory protein